jgi:hypothetical protein
MPPQGMHVPLDATHSVPLSVHVAFAQQGPDMAPQVGRGRRGARAALVSRDLPRAQLASTAPCVVEASSVPSLAHFC